MKKTEYIRWNESDIKSIKRAERKKTKLENLGYSLIYSRASLFSGESCYKLKG